MSFLGHVVDAESKAGVTLIRADPKHTEVIKLEAPGKNVRVKSQASVKRRIRRTALDARGVNRAHQTCGARCFPRDTSRHHDRESVCVLCRFPHVFVASASARTPTGLQNNVSTRRRRALDSTTRKRACSRSKGCVSSIAAFERVLEPSALTGNASMRRLRWYPTWLEILVDA